MSHYDDKNNRKIIMNKKKFKLVALIFVALLFSINGYTVDFETEPNSSVKEADPIFNEVTLEGHFTRNDEDWFFFDTTSSDVLTVTTDSGSSGVDISIYNENDLLLFDNLVSSGVDRSIKVGLASAGRYFIKAKKSVYSSYSLTISLANTEPHSNLQCIGETGWWWNENEPGRGYSLEQQGDAIFFAAYLYDDSGLPTWFIALMKKNGKNKFKGNLEEYANGQTLLGAYQKAEKVNDNVGEITLTFSDKDKGILIWPGGTVPITRFIFSTKK